MQIIIDISESDFNYIKNHGTEIHPRVYHAFEKAIILSEKMDRVEAIERNAALDDIGLGEFHRYDDYAKMRNYLKSIPTIIGIK